MNSMEYLDQVTQDSRVSKKNTTKDTSNFLDLSMIGGSVADTSSQAVSGEGTTSGPLTIHLPMIKSAKNDEDALLENIQSLHAIKKHYMKAVKGKDGLVEMSKDRIRNYVQNQINETQNLIMEQVFTPRKNNNEKYEFLLDQVLTTKKKSMQVSPEVFHRMLPKAVHRNLKK